MCIKFKQRQSFVSSFTEEVNPFSRTKPTIQAIKADIILEVGSICTIGSQI